MVPQCNFVAAQLLSLLVQVAQEVKVLLRRLKRDNPNIENSIFRSIHGVALDTMPGYKTEGQEHSFLERFDRVEAELQKELKEKQKQEADKTE